ncbi:hypothetical protein Ae263Ps1_5688c [Pseudonocardia sp. Ae263_Ps1]|nr:hypothetical protein Ae150APs1_5636 [Pseudonocardia sp. Ae150A_Ps1]OLL88633.1 hypothetical protein Ae263Ps1_5688c [Pseudonocardia sp. Ae263_Ps1]OLL91346.1 hypothetical protein Ae356Ps1_1243 [Pseudonocardia sp. Ae356_Ps1]
MGQRGVLVAEHPQRAAHRVVAEQDTVVVQRGVDRGQRRRHHPRRGRQVDGHGIRRVQRDEIVRDRGDVVGAGVRGEPVPGHEPGPALVVAHMEVHGPETATRHRQRPRPHTGPGSGRLDTNRSVIPGRRRHFRTSPTRRRPTATIRCQTPDVLTPTRPPEVRRGRHRAPVPAPSWLLPAALPAGAAVLAAGVFLLVRDALVDDAYITLTYVRNLAFHGHWGANLDGISHTATSPLNVLLQAVVTVVVRDAVVAAGIVLAGLAATVTWWSQRTGDHLGWPRWTAALPAALLLVNPLLLSTVGLETYLAVTLLAGLAYAAVTGRVVVAGVVCGLLTLTRPDLVVVAAVAALAVPVLRRRLATVLAAAVAVSLPWYAFSWVALGSVVPDTVLWKIGDSWGRHHITFTDGLFVYHERFPEATVLALLPAAAGLVGGVSWLLARRPGAVAPVVLGLGAVVHAGAFVVIGTAPYHWYYGPAVGALSLLAAWTVGALATGVPAVVLGVAAAGLVVVSGEFDLRHGTPWTVAPIATNRATTAEYATVAAGLHGKVVSAGELGALAYFCADRCAIDDPLSERAPMLARIEQRRAAAGPVTRVLLDANYLFLEPAPYHRGTTRLVSRSGHHPEGVDVGTPWSGPENLRLVPVG